MLIVYRVLMSIKMHWSLICLLIGLNGGGANNHSYYFFRKRVFIRPTEWRCFNYLLEIYKHVT